MRKRHNFYMGCHPMGFGFGRYPLSLEEEVSKPDHWLEGAIIKQDLANVRLMNARLPHASFEGIRLVNVLFNGALLERANFRSASLEGTVLFESNLRRAAFDQATLRRAGDFPVDLRGAVGPV